MQESHLFEYAVVRVVPHVEREEFVNVGVVLFCAYEKFLQARFHLDEGRLKMLSDSLDVVEIKDHIRSFERICAGGNEGGAIGKLPLAERFRWLTATRSTVLQTSKVHPGLCIDASQTLSKLYGQLVLKN